MDIYTEEAANTDPENNQYQCLMSSTTLVETRFEKSGSFFSPRIPTEDMKKLMEVSFSVDPYKHKILAF